MRQTYLVDVVVERRLLPRWRSKKARHKLPYVSIEDDLRRQTSWPPPSQLGCSLVDIMRLESSFFQAEQAEEALLPKSSSGDSVTDASCALAQTELNDIVLKNESCCIISDSSSKPIGLDTLSPAKSDKPHICSGTVL